MSRCPRAGALERRTEVLSDMVRAHRTRTGRRRRLWMPALGSWMLEQGLMIRRTRSEVGRELPEVSRIVHAVEHDASVIDAERGTAERLAAIILGDMGGGRRRSLKPPLKFRLASSTGHGHREGALRRRFRLDAPRRRRAERRRVRVASRRLRPPCRTSPAVRSRAHGRAEPAAEGRGEASVSFAHGSCPPDVAPGRRRSRRPAVGLPHGGLRWRPIGRQASTSRRSVACIGTVSESRSRPTTHQRGRFRPGGDRRSRREGGAG